MRWCDRRLILVLLSLVLFAAPAIGATMVPDPTWIGGMYDGGDGDEVAILMWDRTAGVVPDIAPPLSPTGAVALDPPVTPAAVSAPLPRPASRAPPLV
ncbi:MAG TPA: hypothetical protein VFL90_00530 [Methylomirabilota bacterium]|nr:hypothetical protein [Methylomirabilota bacterium]